MHRHLGTFAALAFAIYIASHTKTIQQLWRTSWSQRQHTMRDGSISPEQQCYASLGIYIDQQDNFILAKGEGQFTANVIAQGHLARGGIIDAAEGDTKTFEFWTHAQKGDRKELRVAFESLFSLAKWDRSCIASLVLLPSIPLTEKQKDTLQETADLKHKLILTDLGATIHAFDIRYSSGDISSLAVISKLGAVTLKRVKDPERCSGWRMQPREYPPPVDINSLFAFDPDNIFDQIVAIEADISTTPSTPFLRRASTDAIARGAAIEAGRDFWRTSMEWHTYVRLGSDFSVALSPHSVHEVLQGDKEGQLVLTTSQDKQERVSLYIMRDDKPVSKLELQGLSPRAAGEVYFIVSLTASWAGDNGVDVLAQLIDMQTGQRASKIIDVGWVSDEFETISQNHKEREQLVLAPIQSEKKHICGGYCDEGRLSGLFGSLRSDEYSLNMAEDDEDKAELQRDIDETRRQITELEKKIRAKNGAFERAL